MRALNETTVLCLITVLLCACAKQPVDTVTVFAKTKPGWVTQHQSGGLRPDITSSRVYGAGSSPLITKDTSVEAALMRGRVDVTSQLPVKVRLLLTDLLVKQFTREKIVLPSTVNVDVFISSLTQRVTGMSDLTGKSKDIIETILLNKTRADKLPYKTHEYWKDPETNILYVLISVDLSGTIFKQYKQAVLDALKTDAGFTDRQLIWIAKLVSRQLNVRRDDFFRDVGGNTK
jgi:hypothetical protein